MQGKRFTGVTFDMQFRINDSRARRNFPYCSTSCANLPPLIIAADMFVICGEKISKVE